MKLHEVTDGRGKQVLLFSDYINRLAEISEEKAADFKKIGIALFKASFTYEDAAFHLIPDEGGIYEISFPLVRDALQVERGDLYARYYVFKQGEKYEYARMISTREVLLYKVPVFLNFMKEAARARK